VVALLLVLLALTRAEYNRQELLVLAGLFAGAILLFCIVAARDKDE
jgi:hypothetical protein